MRTVQSQVRFEDQGCDPKVVISAGQKSTPHKAAGGSVVKPYALGQSTSQLERRTFWLERHKQAGAAPNPLSVADQVG